METKKIEIAIPCLNEETTIAKVAQDFRSAIPEADVVVYDNNSSDASIELAKKSGARVVIVNNRGKGHVIREIFESSQADIVIVVDGDDTYEAKDARLLIQPLLSRVADMTIGTRLHYNPSEFRRMHHLGNRIITRMLNFIFRTNYSDVLSGYRAFTRRFIQRVPVISFGFEVETELMIQSLENGVIIKEVPIHFRKRPTGSYSKLNAIADGYRIVLTMISMLRDHRPLFIFTLIGAITASVGFIIWIVGFLHSTSTIFFSVLRNIGALLIVFAAGFFTVGLILNTINVRVHELASLLRRK